MLYNNSRQKQGNFRLEIGFIKN